MPRHCSTYRIRRKVRSNCLAQAQRLAGYSLGELAALAGVPIPRDLKRDKGWIGILLEIWLGASAGQQTRAGFRRAWAWS